MSPTRLICSNYIRILDDHAHRELLRKMPSIHTASLITHGFASALTHSLTKAGALPCTNRAFTI